MYIILLMLIFFSLYLPDFKSLQPVQPINQPHRRHGLVITHPDDESMFFKPLLSNLSLIQKQEVHILCISAEDDNIRKAELLKACEVFGILPERVHLVEEQSHNWNIIAIQKHVEEFVREHDIQVVYTFDKQGVSGHLHHIAIHYGTVNVVKSLGIEGYELESTNMFRKYMGMLDIPISKLLVPKGGRIYVCKNLLLSIKAMQSHPSQFVWYRKLFICFSRYSYCNTFKPIVHSYV